MTWAGLEVQLELDLEVEGKSTTVTSTGRQLTLHSEDLGHLITQARTASVAAGLPARSSRQTLAHAGRVLHEAGLSLDIADRHGTLLRLGRGRRSAGARLLTGAEHAEFGRPRAVLGSAVTLARLSTQAAPLRGFGARVLLGLLSGAGIAAAALAVRRRLRT